MKLSICMMILVFIYLAIVSNDSTSELKTKPHSKDQPRYDYAALESGGNILEHSRQMFGTKGILRDDNDKYLLVPCSIQEKWVEISLLEYILIDEIQFIQGEIYSSSFKNVEVQFSTHYPSDSWETLASIDLLPVSQPQKFKVENKWVRFLKIIFKSHYENEYYCTLTQFSVFGSSILQEIDDSYYKAKQEEVQGLLHEVNDLNHPENTINVFRQQTQQLNQIELFYDNTSEESVCLNEFLFNFTCYTEQFVKPTAIKAKNLKSTQVDIFQAMVKHMAKTEAYLKVYDFYILHLLESHNEKEVFRQKIEEAIVRIKTEIATMKRTLKDLNEADAKNINITDQLSKQIEEFADSNKMTQKSLQQIMFWNYFLVVVLFLCILFALGISAHPKKKELKTISTQCNTVPSFKHKRANTNLFVQ